MSRATSAVVQRTHASSRIRGAFAKLVIWATAWVGVTAAVVLGSAATAAAQDSVQDWEAVTGVESLPGPGYYTDYSGGVLNPDGSLLVVDNGEDHIIEYVQNNLGDWSITRIIKFSESGLSDSIDDVEDITRMGGNRYAVIDEYDNTLTVFDLAPGATTVDEVYTVALWPYVDSFGGNGIEGLFYSFEDSTPDTDSFYVASEVNALIVKLDIVDGQVTNRGRDIRLNIPAASAVHRVPNDGTFYVVANRGRSVYRFNSDGVQLGPGRRLDFGNPEGMTFSDDGSRILIIGEARGNGNEIQEFRPPTQRGVTTLNRFLQPNSDAIQPGDGFTRLGGNRLYIGPGPYNESALRVESLCIPDDAQIRRASLSFAAAESEYDTAGLRVTAHAAVSSPVLQEAQYNISGRNATVTVASETESAGWSRSNSWRYFAPDLTDVINEVRALPGRGECGPITFRVSTTGARRTARSSEDGAERAPTLVIDWVRVPAVPNVTVSATPDCAGGSGRVTVSVTNTSGPAQNVIVKLTESSDRSVFIDAGGTRSVSWSGLPDKRYLASAVVAGVPTTNDAVLVDCGAPVRAGSSCDGPGNGRITLDVLNASHDHRTFTLTVGDLDLRYLWLHGWERGVEYVGGVPDGQHQVTVNQDDVVIAAGSIAVSCGPTPIPVIPAGACTYTLNNDSPGGVYAIDNRSGRFDVISYVAGGEIRELPMPAGFDPSVGDSFTLYGVYGNSLEWNSTNAAGVAVPCGSELFYPFQDPIVPVPEFSVAPACGGAPGEVIVELGTQLGGFQVVEVTLRDSSRTVGLSPGFVYPMIFVGVTDGDARLTVQNGGELVFDDTLAIDCGLPNAQRGQEDPASGNGVVHATSCLAGNGRHDVTWVNIGAAAARYRIEFEGLSPRERIIAAGDWGRMPVTGRPDGTYQVRVLRDGVVVSDHQVVVTCDAPVPQLADPQVQVVSSCRNGFGYVLFQMVNPTAAVTGYVIEFEGVPNRSTSAAGYGAAVRAVTGRPEGSYEAVVRVGNSTVTTFMIDVTCP